MNRYMCLLLVLGTSAFLLARVEAQGNSGGGSNNNNNQGKSNQDRDDAINASKPGKPRKGAAGTLANGKLKSERFTECFNKMNKDMAVSTLSWTPIGCFDHFRTVLCTTWVPLAAPHCLRALLATSETVICSRICLHLSVYVLHLHRLIPGRLQEEGRSP